MKGKPPFILYSNINKPQSSQISKKSINPIYKIYNKIPVNVLKETPEIEKLVHPDPKVYYSGIKKYEKPKMMSIKYNMNDELQKKISNINEFREMFYNYNEEEREQLNDFFDIQDENNKFSRNFQKVQKEKNKFSTGTYLDHQYLIGIASRYATRGIRVPKVSVDKNVFSANPLILGGSDLERYFLYNLGERKKSSAFLNKVNHIIRKKITGNNNLSEEEMKKFEILKKNEKPKGYIPPNILIPQLKNEINQTKSTYENLEDFDKFFEDKDKDNSLNYKPQNSRLILNLRNSHSCNNIFDNIIRKNDNNKIKIKQNLSFIKNIKKVNNIKFSSVSTRANGPSKRISSSNSGNIISFKDISKSNVSSAVSREKSKFLKYTPILSPFNRGNNNSNLYNKLYNDITKKENNSNDFFILSKPFDYPENDAYNVLYDNINKKNNKSARIISNNINNKKILIRKKLFSFRKNSAFSKISKSINNLKEDKEQESDDDEIRLLNKELEGKNDIKITNEQSNSNININNENDISDKNNEINDNDNNNNLDKQRNIKISKDLINNMQEIGVQTNKNDDNYIKIEKIFNSLLGDGYKSRRSKSVVSEFLKSRGYNISKKYASKDAYININRMKTKAIERNFLLEEFKIRNGDYSKTPLSHVQQAIIDKNELYAQEIEKNEFILKKLLCEKNIDKESIEN